MMLEKELFDVVHCLKLWQHHLGLLKTIIYMENVYLKYIKNHPKITPKNWRQVEVLALFDIELGTIQLGKIGRSMP